MSYFDVLGSIFEIWAITDLPNIIVSMCLVSYNICMIPHVCKVTFGLNLSGAWGTKLWQLQLQPARVTLCSAILFMGLYHKQLPVEEILHTPSHSLLARPHTIVFSSLNKHSSPLGVITFYSRIKAWWRRIVPVSWLHWWLQGKVVVVTRAPDLGLWLLTRHVSGDVLNEE